MPTGGGIYEAGMMNKAYFWQTLFKSKNDLESKKLLDTNEPAVTFDKTKSIIILDTVFGSDSVLCPKASASIDLYQGEVPTGKFECEVLVNCPRKEWDIWQMAQLIVQYYDGTKPVKTVLIRLHRFVNDGDESWIDLTTSSPPEKYEKVKVSVWNPSQNQICIKAIKIYADREN